MLLYGAPGINRTFTAHTGSLVSPTRNVTSHNSGIDAKNFMSSASPVLFSKVDKSGSAESARPERVNTSGIAEAVLVYYIGDEKTKCYIIIIILK